MREAKERQWPGPLPHHVELLAALVGDHDGQLRHREQEAAVQRRKGGQSNLAARKRIRETPEQTGRRRVGGAFKCPYSCNPYG